MMRGSGIRDERDCRNRQITDVRRNDYFETMFWKNETEIRVYEYDLQQSNANKFAIKGCSVT